MPSATRPQRPARWLRRRLRDLLDLQQRRLVAQRVALDAREPGVDHVADAGHRQRRLGDVGREHDAPAARSARTRAAARRPTAARTAAGSRRRAHTGRRARPRAQQLAGLADLALAGQEHEDVARTFAPQVLGGVDDRLLELLLVVGLASPSPRRVAAAGSEHRPDTCGPTPRSPAPARRRSPKCRAKRSASSVADVTMTLRSGARGSSCFR